MKTAKQIIITMVLGIAMLGASVCVNAQSPTKPIAQVSEKSDPYIFLNAGAGIGAFHGVNDLFYGIEFGTIYKNNINTLRPSKALGETGSDLFFVDAEPNEKISDYGILFGRVEDGGSVVLSASAGIAYT